MRYIIHGDDLVSSRSYLNSLKSQYQEVINIEDKKNSAAEYLDAVINQPLFSKKTLVVLENYGGSEKIYELQTASDLAFWWPRSLQNVPAADEIVHFKNQSAFGIFRYADSIGQRQERTALVLLEKLIEERVPAEKITVMLARQIKMIGQILDGDLDKVSSSEFVRKKLYQQSKNWDFRRIQEALMLMFSIDIKIKKGEAKPESALTFLTHKLCS